MSVTKFKVLIADDNEAIREGLKEIFLCSGYDVITAADGKQAAHLTYATHPDIIIMDYQMPHKTGFEAVEEIRNYPSCANIPIIILTSNGEKPVKLKGLSLEIDDFITKPADAEEILARVKLLIRRSLQRMDCNPLTKLPGNPSIQSRLEKEIRQGGKFALIYADINNFKPYNDVYGFKAGDNVILQTAKIMENCAFKHDRESFIGHIGGDDFVCICKYEKAKEISQDIISAFDTLVQGFYPQQDAAQGFIITEDRQGEKQRFGLLSVALAVVHNNFKPLLSFAQASATAAELKHFAKSKGKSYAAFDKRIN